MLTGVCRNSAIYKRPFQDCSIFHCFEPCQPRPTSNIALKSVTGKLLLRDKAKARAFRNQYVSVSWKDHGVLTKGRSRETKAMFRAVKIEVLKYIHSSCTSPQASPFSVAELNSCISDLDGSAASGLDQMTNLMLINLDKSNKQELLALYNLSWKLGVSPKEWT